MMLFMFGRNKYKVDYCGQKNLFTGAKSSYTAGTQVKLYYSRFASDTSYSFYLDDEQLRPSYDSKKGFVITFTMPKHDVKLCVKTRNTMLPPIKREFTIEKKTEPSKAATLVCPECGTEITENANFCCECGRKLNLK